MDRDRGQPGTTYHIAVAAEKGIPGDVQLRWTNVPPIAPHDHLSNATPIEGETGWAFASNFGSWVHPDEPLHAGEDGGTSVWYEWTAPRDGSITFMTRYSDVDTLLAVYTGSTYRELNEVASNNNYGIEWSNRPGNSQVTFEASAGTSYKIAVDTYTGTYDYFELHWGPPPDNDDFENSQSIDGLPTSALGDLTLATAEASEPIHAFWSVANSVWYSWTAPADGPVAVRVTALDWGWDPEVAVYTGDDVAHLTPVDWFRTTLKATTTSADCSSSRPPPARPITSPWIEPTGPVAGSRSSYDRRSLLTTTSRPRRISAPAEARCCLRATGAPPRSRERRITQGPRVAVPCGTATHHPIRARSRCRHRGAPSTRPSRSTKAMVTAP